MTEKQYDVLVLGSGIAGSTLALTLRRSGLSVLVVDEKKHPRFAIGEAMVPTTSRGFERLADEYGVPELGQVFTYTGLKAAGCVGFPKQHGFFGHHEEGCSLREEHQLMFEPPNLPIGPDVHMLRADVDAFLVSKYEKYDIDILEECKLLDHTVGSERVSCTLESSDGKRSVSTKLIVDASGVRSKLAAKQGMLRSDSGFLTNSRAIFSHFRGVRKLESLLDRSNPAFRFSRDAGTQQHCFEGGWIWVIRFDNGISSVGAVLDRDVFPVDETLTPEQEFDRLLKRFPTVKAQLGSAVPEFPMVRTGRLQHRAESIVGDGVLLGPNTAGFVDPLFSTGFTLIQSYAGKFAPLAAKVLKDPDYDPTRSLEQFRDLERGYFKELEVVDLVISGIFKSFRNFDVFKQYWRLWVATSVQQFYLRLGSTPDTLGGPGLIYGAGVPSWVNVIRQMHQLVVNNHNDVETAKQLKAIMDQQPEPLSPHYANYEIESKEACLARLVDLGHFRKWRKGIMMQPDLVGRLDGKRYARFRRTVMLAHLKLAVRVSCSQMFGTDYAKHIRMIRDEILDRSHPPTSFWPRPPKGSRHKTFSESSAT